MVASPLNAADFQPRQRRVYLMASIEDPPAALHEGDSTSASVVPQGARGHAQIEGTLDLVHDERRVGLSLFGRQTANGLIMGFIFWHTFTVFQLLTCVIAGQRQHNRGCR
jgi:hypothetical protein